MEVQLSSICVNVYAWSHTRVFSNEHSSPQTVQKSNEVQRHDRMCEYSPTVRLLLLQLSNAFHCVSLKQLKNWDILHFLSSMSILNNETHCKTCQLYLREYRQEHTKFCKHRHAWVTNLSTQTYKMLTFNSALKVSVQRNIKKVSSCLFSEFHLKDHLCRMEEASTLSEHIVWPRKQKWFISENKLAGF